VWSTDAGLPVLPTLLHWLRTGAGPAVHADLLSMGGAHVLAWNMHETSTVLGIVGGWALPLENWHGAHSTADTGSESQGHGNLKNICSHKGTTIFFPCKNCQLSPLVV
jgi:hypothetical protein